MVSPSDNLSYIWFRLDCWNWELEWDLNSKKWDFLKHIDKKYNSIDGFLELPTDFYHSLSDS